MVQCSSISGNKPGITATTEYKALWPSVIPLSSEIDVLESKINIDGTKKDIAQKIGGYPSILSALPSISGLSSGQVASSEKTKECMNNYSLKQLHAWTWYI